MKKGVTKKPSRETIRKRVAGQKRAREKRRRMRMPSFLIRRTLYLPQKLAWTPRVIAVTRPCNAGSGGWHTSENYRPSIFARR